MPKNVIWALPKWANDKFERMLLELLDLDQDSDEAFAIREDIRGLPGYPRHVRDDGTLIHRQITTISH